MIISAGKLSWLPNGQNCRPEWREGITLNPAIKMVSDLVITSAGLWNKNLIRQLFAKGSTSEILRLPVLRSSLEDQWIWTKEKNEIFPVKFLVEVEQRRRALAAQAMDATSWNRVWKLKLQDKLKLMLWKVAAGAIKTKGALGRIL